MSFRLVRNHSLKKDAGQASMTDVPTGRHEWFKKAI